MLTSECGNHRSKWLVEASNKRSSSSIGLMLTSSDAFPERESEVRDIDATGIR